LCPVRVHKRKKKLYSNEYRCARLPSVTKYVLALTAIHPVAVFAGESLNFAVEK
jgi:hypothetical protein